jgi:imidazole glycerol-phosphate synthase subunit HisH
VTAAPAPSIAVLDAGSGNLRSVEKALARVGGHPVVTADPDVIRRADRVVVPGQGAFGEFMAALAARGLGEALAEVIAAGRPYLGICLGLQVLFEQSEEQGPVAGLGLLPGRVVRFRPASPALKVPHMGWNQVRLAHPEGRPEPLLAGIADGSYFYFVHSYYVDPADRSLWALGCEYGERFAAAVRKDNLFACQFHPEKSQRVGLALLANFVESP